MESPMGGSRRDHKDKQEESEVEVERRTSLSQTKRMCLDRAK